MKEKKKREIQNLQANSQVQVASTEERNFRNNHLRHKRPRDDERKFNTMTIPIYSRLCNSCYNCGALGHHSKECQAPMQLAKWGAWCFYCGKTGHIRKDCPEQRGQDDAPTKQAPQRRGRHTRNRNHPRQTNDQKEQNLAIWHNLNIVWG